MRTRRSVVLSVAILLSGLLSAHPLRESSPDPSDDSPGMSPSARLLTLITITTNPAGLQVSIDGAMYIAPQTMSWTSGTQHTISVPSPQGSSGTRRVFSSWSDGRAQTHTISVDSSARTYTATFTTQYLLTAASSPVGAGGIGGTPSSPDGYYASGTSVQLTAAPVSGYRFASWSGDLTGSANPQTITMSAPRSVTANFTNASTITITTNPAGLQMSVDGTSYTGPKLFLWQIGSQHTISALSPQGSAGTRRIFSSWSDGRAQSHSISVGASDATYVANYISEYLLSTASIPVGAGSVSKVPASADGYYSGGTTVQLNATPASQYTFVGWSGDLTGSANPQAITMSSPRSVTANFANLLNVTIATNPPGLQIIIDGISYTAPQTFNWETDAQHTISVPSPQSSGGTRRVFSAWSDGGAQTHTITVGLLDVTYTASFATQHLLTATSSPAGGGSISKSPASSDGYYSSGTSVQLTAYPASEYRFTGWGNDLAGAANPQSITISSPRSVTANFARVSAVDENSLARPTTFSLDWNYPNPFNPSTTIRYGLPYQSWVTLTVFNALGLPVALLLNKEVDAGYHEVRFDGSALPAGVYFYRLNAGMYVEVKKMIVVK